MNKICSKCHKEKNIEEFYKDSKSKDNHRNDCIKCNILRSKLYQKNNSQRILEKNRKWVKNNRDYIKEWKRKWFQLIEKPKRKQRYKADKNYRNKCILRSKQYRTNPKNKEKINLWRRYFKEKNKNNQAYKILRNLRGRLRFVLKGKRKLQHTMDLIGCSREDLVNHLQSQFIDGMSWKNYGIDGWHIDHIVPCAKFNLSKLEEQKKCFHYTNLQPLWASDNLSKGSK